MCADTSTDQKLRKRDERTPKESQGKSKQYGAPKNGITLSSDNERWESASTGVFRVAQSLTGSKWRSWEGDSNDVIRTRHSDQSWRDSGTTT